MNKRVSRVAVFLLSFLIVMGLLSSCRKPLVTEEPSASDPSMGSQSLDPIETTDDDQSGLTTLPSVEPTVAATTEPTNTPTPEPTHSPTPEPTNSPTPEPTNTPTPLPTNTPVPSNTPKPTNPPAPTSGPPLTSSPDGRTGSALATPFTKNGIILLNKQHWVSSAYAPLPADKNKWSLQADAWTAWKEMEAAAASQNLTLRFVSGYRTYAYQEWLFNDYASRDPVGANRYSARAGQSEHQSGLALDMDNGIGKTGLTEAFADTAEGKWLWANAYKYGWILRYPRGKEHITGYVFEPWHYRYVGKAVAADFGPNNTMTLEEYLGELPSKYDGKGSSPTPAPTTTVLEPTGRHYVPGTYKNVSGQNLMIRSGPGTAYEQVGTIAAGVSVSITAFETVDGNQIWGQHEAGWSCLELAGAVYLELD